MNQISVELSCKNLSSIRHYDDNSDVDRCCAMRGRMIMGTMLIKEEQFVLIRSVQVCMHFLSASIFNNSTVFEH